MGLIGRDEALLRQVASECGGETGHAVFAVGDLSTAHGVEHTIGACLDGLGGVDILVNNAGSSPVGTIDDLSDEQWQTAFDLKVMGYLRCMRAVLPRCGPRASGASSTSGAPPGCGQLRVTPWPRSTPRSSTSPARPPSWSGPTASPSCRCTRGPR